MLLHRDQWITSANSNPTIELYDYATFALSLVIVIDEFWYATITTNGFWYIDTTTDGIWSVTITIDGIWSVAITIDGLWNADITIDGLWSVATICFLISFSTNANA